MAQPRRRISGKRLLIASLGVGMLNLTNCREFTSGNLPAPPPCDDAGNYSCPDPVDMAAPVDLAKKD